MEVNPIGPRLPARIDPGLLVGRRQRRAAENVVGGLLAVMMDGASRLPLVTRGKIERVGDTQALDADHAAFRIDDAHLVGRAPIRRSAGVICALGMGADEVVEFVVGLHI